MLVTRKDLGVGSTIAVPHAISRKCLEGIGWDTLHTACVAQVKAILEGYKVECSPFCRCNETKSHSATRAFYDDGTSTSCIENYWGSFRRTFIFIEE